MYLPPCIDPKTAAEIKKIDLTTEFRGNQPVLSYTITWLEKKTDKKLEGSIKSSSKKTESQSRSVTSSLSDDSLEAKSPVQSAKKISSMMKFSGSELPSLLPVGASYSPDVARRLRLPATPANGAEAVTARR